jgi:hypothetical protein
MMSAVQKNSSSLARIRTKNNRFYLILRILARKRKERLFTWSLMRCAKLNSGMLLSPKKSTGSTLTTLITRGCAG